MISARNYSPKVVRKNNFPIPYNMTDNSLCYEYEPCLLKSNRIFEKLKVFNVGGWVYGDILTLSGDILEIDTNNESYKESKECIENVKDCSVIIRKGKLIILGGKNFMKNFEQYYFILSNALIEIDIKTMKSSIINMMFENFKNIPFISNHSSLYWEKKDIMFVYGGYEYVYSKKVLQLKLLFFDFRKKIWDVIDYDKEINSKHPTPRTGQSIHLLNDDEFILFGGFNYQLESWFNDVWIFNFEKKEWREIEFFGDVPEKRSCVGSIVFQNKLWIVGGSKYYKRYCSDVYCLDLNTYNWIRYNINSELFPKRACPSILLKYDMKNIKFVCYGGLIVENDKRCTINDVFEITLDCYIMKINRMSLCDCVIKCI